MKISAITGSGQPIARRVASSSSTSRIEPITTSIVSGLPTRNAMSSKMYGMYSTEIATAIASAQSISGTPPGVFQPPRRGASAALREKPKTMKISPSTKARCTPRWVVSRSRPKPAV